MGIREYMPHLQGEKSETREWIDAFKERGHEKILNLLEGKNMKAAVFTRDVHDRLNSCAYAKGTAIQMSDTTFARFNKRYPGALMWQQEFKAKSPKEEVEEVVAVRQEDSVPGAPPRKLTKKQTVGKGKP